jgi:hypothetical protein
MLARCFRLVASNVPPVAREANAKASAAIRRTLEDLRQSFVQTGAAIAELRVGALAFPAKAWRGARMR